MPPYPRGHLLEFRQEVIEIRFHSEGQFEHRFGPLKAQCVLTVDISLAELGSSVYTDQTINAQRLRV